MADPKDDVPRSHGQEWFSFYESLDQHVRDQLSRSSELLRQAMALPEVAEAEVRRVRAEMSELLAAERDGRRELLTQLQSDLAESLERVSMLALGVGVVIQELERLGQRVDAALSENTGDREPGTAPGAGPGQPGTARSPGGPGQRGEIGTESQFAHTERSAPEAQVTTPEVDRAQHTNRVPAADRNGHVNAVGADRRDSEPLAAHSQSDGRRLTRPHWLASSRDTSE